MNAFVFVAFMFFALLSTPDFFGSIHVVSAEDDVTAAPDAAAAEGTTLASNADDKNSSTDSLLNIPGIEGIQNIITNITNSITDSGKGPDGWISKLSSAIADGIKKIGSSLGSAWDFITQPLKNLWPFKNEKKA
ncbi:hypothetical protein PV325_007569 [Microctonus aethiopoides]|nr:hypothetical protein PV325_007569 [Microctonus aethiopoides]